VAKVNLSPTPQGWLEVVLGNFDTFLEDHASCEKKASGMALNMASHYPDQPQLLLAMADLAVEELTHYRDVLRLLADRGVQPGPDVRDDYVRRLNALIRRGPEHYLLDRLLVAAVIERRGHERFGLIANAVTDPALARFYRAITRSEDRHWQLFLELAANHCDHAAIPARLEEITGCEADIIELLPLRAALH
jgi:tRNA-(ms[2]io[6]A)-hydroxylase